MKTPESNAASAGSCVSNSPFRRFAQILALFAAMCLGAAGAKASSIFVPNDSFEFPVTDFAGPAIGSWKKSPEPAWYQGGGGFPWEQLTGLFLNTAAGSSNHIDNLESSQSAFLFALPDVALSQENDPANPLDPFDVKFEAGKSYAMTVAVLGGGGGMTNDATLELSFYYRDAASNAVTVAAATVTNSLALFPTNTHFLDFQVRTPIVRATDAWAGKHIGIRIASTTGFDKQGGYWDIDDVRVTESIVPNGSFESPDTDFASPLMDGWQSAPEPAWYQGGGGFPWFQLVGQFLNTTNGSPDSIDNMDGEQAAFLFALPDVAIFQDYTSIGGTNIAPTHDFNATFETGKSYAFTLAVLGGGGGMTNEATLEMSLYYRDAASNRVTVSSTTITNTKALFPTNTHFLDFQVRTPIVRAADAWAGKHIGIRIASTVGFDKQGGYWDIDNARVTESIVPNGSFENPDTDFASPLMDDWQRSPEPAWYQGGGGFPWFQLVGQFLNTTNGSPDSIDNVDGEQALFLFALPDVAIFQDYTTFGGTNTAPTHDFNAIFDPGSFYSLNVAVLGGGGGMTNEATLELSLYYRDAASNMVTVATTTITNTKALFPTNTHFVDFQVRTPVTQASDAWVGKQVGIRIASTVGFDKQGGYWNLDNVRLKKTVAPASGALALKNAAIVSGQFQVTLEGAPGRYEIISSAEAAAPLASWTSLGTVTITSGSATFTDSSAPAGNRFYQARQAP